MHIHQFVVRKLSKLYITLESYEFKINILKMEYKDSKLGKFESNKWENKNWESCAVIIWNILISKSNTEDVNWI